jgi:hypothetical protein
MSAGAWEPEKSKDYAQLTPCKKVWKFYTLSKFIQNNWKNDAKNSTYEQMNTYMVYIEQLIQYNSYP